MQITIQLDDALLAQVTEMASERGCDLSHFIEESLREKIARPPVKPPAISKASGPLPTVDGQGLHPGVNLDDSAALLDLMDQRA